jgi:hypothetical protein
MASTLLAPCNQYPGSPVYGGRPTLGTRQHPWHAERERGDRYEAAGGRRGKHQHLLHDLLPSKLSQFQSESTRPPHRLLLPALPHRASP